MLFYQVGELFQSYAVGKSRQSISDMMDICPEYANIEENGTLTQVDPDDVEVGSIIVIKPGERVPLDGIIIEGESLIDTAALTGEGRLSTITGLVRLRQWRRCISETSRLDVRRQLFIRCIRKKAWRFQRTLRGL